jgi:hypothetical protein
MPEAQFSAREGIPISIGLHIFGEGGMRGETGGSPVVSDESRDDVQNSMRPKHQPILPADNEETGGVTYLGVWAKETVPAAGLKLFDVEQGQGHDIVLRHLEETPNNRGPMFARLMVHGESGTGKSRIVGLVAAAFAAKGVSHLLDKAAYTGQAASVIGGKTAHTIGQAGIDRTKIGEEGKRRLQALLRKKQYVIINEISMISNHFWAQMLRNILIRLEGVGCHIFGSSAGGLDVIVCHQGRGQA